MQYCTKYNTACKLPTCKHGEEIKGFDFEADSHELSLDQMSKEQEAQFWKKWRRFFEPRNPHWKVTTDKNVYVGIEFLSKIIEECDYFEEK